MTPAQGLADAPLGRVITFYSYKGGTGRSMALANAAWMLAANGQRVLVIDWDLEAPGLQRYFQPYLRDAKLEASDGLMDFVLAFADAARAPPAETDSGSSPDTGWYERQADLRMFAYAVNWPGFAKRGGRLDFVPAGRQDSGYSLRVNSFNWQHFYSKLGGGIFLEEVKQRLRTEYDYVLIDSRTGVSDTSGVCTVQMPDTLVVFFTLNEQSIHGAASTANSASEQRRKPDGSATLRIMPVPTRVDSSEKQRVDAARAAARERFDGLLDWLDEDQLEDYWSDVETPYIPFYSLEEVLAVFDQPRVRTSLLPSVEGLVSWLSEQRITELPAMDERQRMTEIARYLRPVKALSAPSAAAPGETSHGETVFFVNYSRRDADTVLREFLGQLATEVGALTGLPAHQVMFLDHAALEAGTFWESQLQSALASTATVLCLLSPGWLINEWARKEILLARQYGKPVLSIEWVPMAKELPSSVMPEPLLRSPSRGGFRYLAREGEGAEYRGAVFDLAERLASAWVTRQAANALLPPARPAWQAAAATILVPIVAERRRVMQQAYPKADNYGVRRQDWTPFPRELDRSAGETVQAVAASVGKVVQLISLHRFRDWLADPVAPGSAVVLIDALTAERPEYERQLLEWDRQTAKPVCAIVCVSDKDQEAAYRTRYQTLASSSRIVWIAGSADTLQGVLMQALRDFAISTDPTG